METIESQSHHTILLGWCCRTIRGQTHATAHCWHLSQASSSYPQSRLLSLHGSVGAWWNLFRCRHWVLKTHRYLDPCKDSRRCRDDRRHRGGRISRGSKESTDYTVDDGISPWTSHLAWSKRDSRKVLGHLRMDGANHRDQCYCGLRQIIDRSIEGIHQEAQFPQTHWRCFDLAASWIQSGHIDPNLSRCQTEALVLTIQGMDTPSKMKKINDAPQPPSWNRECNQRLRVTRDLVVDDQWMSVLNIIICYGIRLIPPQS